MIIALEGIDGSGKGTQAHMLCNSLEEERLEGVTLLSFPRYGRSVGAELVERYLNGKFTTAGMGDHLGPAMFYALDRFEIAAGLRRYAGDKDKHLVLDRYVASNLAFQSCKEDDEERRFKIQDDIVLIEHVIMGLPAPDMTILFDLAPALSYERVGKKKKRDYTDRTHDIHEAKIDFLAKAASAYREVIHRKLYNNTCIIDVDADKSPEQIHKEVKAFVSSCFR